MLYLKYLDEEGNLVLNLVFFLIIYCYTIPQPPLPLNPQLLPPLQCYMR